MAKKRKFVALFSFLFGLLSISGFSQTSYDFLFIHHSVGFNWLTYGNLYLTLINPKNVGGRKIAMHMATYGDTIGWNTDTCHWRRKFRDRMKQVLTFDMHPDKYYKDPNRYNQIVMFKSCFHNSQIDSIGVPPGDPDSPKRTLMNYIAVFQELALIFDDYPHILFIYVTSPPRNPYDHWSKEASALHRQFCKWLKNTWLPLYKKETGLNNVAVFDFFDILAEPENHPIFPNALKEKYRKGKDSHPTPPGLIAATKAFVPWFNQVVLEWERTKHGGCHKYGKVFPWLHAVGRSNIGNKNFAMRLERVKYPCLFFLFFSPYLNSSSLGGDCIVRIRLSPSLLKPYFGPSKGGDITCPLSIPPLPDLVYHDIFFQGMVFPKNSVSLDNLDLSNMVRVKFLPY